MLHKADDLVSAREVHVKRLQSELEAFHAEAAKRVPDLQAIPLPFG